MSRVLLTGGTGFVGRALCPLLLQAGYQVSIATRSPRTAESIRHVDVRPIAGIGPRVDWSAALRGVSAVVHLAGRLPDGEDDGAAAALYRRVNCEGTAKLAADASAAGVRRLVFLSTAKVFGERTSGDAVFTESSPVRPADAYARSKWEAEQALAGIAGSPLEVVVVRPPVVYGPGVKGNFLALLNLAAKAPVLPFGRLNNRRSMIYVGNLADAIARCVAAAEAGGETFLVRDGEDVSTPELLRMLAAAMGRRTRMVPIPRFLVAAAASMAGRGAQYERLAGSFRINDDKIRHQLEWTAPYTVVQGVNATGRWFVNARGRP